jgi:hypothetical protein
MFWSLETFERKEEILIMLMQWVIFLFKPSHLIFASRFGKRMMAKGRCTKSYNSLGPKMGNLEPKDIYYQLGQEITTGLRGKPTDERAPGEIEGAWTLGWWNLQASLYLQNPFLT